MDVVRRADFSKSDQVLFREDINTLNVHTVRNIVTVDVKCFKQEILTGSVSDIKFMYR